MQLAEDSPGWVIWRLELQSSKIISPQRQRRWIG